MLEPLADVAERYRQTRWDQLFVVGGRWFC